MSFFLPGDGKRIALFFLTLSFFSCSLPSRWILLKPFHKRFYYYYYKLICFFLYVWMYVGCVWASKTVFSGKQTAGCSECFSTIRNVIVLLKNRRNVRLNVQKFWNFKTMFENFEISKQNSSKFVERFIERSKVRSNSRIKTEFIEILESVLESCFGGRL